MGNIFQGKENDEE